MANIRVRVGQRNGVKVISSNKSAQFSVAGASDVSVTDRQGYSVLMWDSINSKYIHVLPEQILDLSDSVDDDEIDFGTW